MKAVRAAVVGGGIIGVAVARELTRVLADAEVTVYEKEPRLAAHQSGHNSGVVHAGLYYEPGSLKARLCRRGVGLLQVLCAEKQVAYEECGKVVVAQDAHELARLHAVHDRAVANGVPDVRMVDRDELRAIEPYARGIAALHSPRTAIIDYVGMTDALADDVRAAGGHLRLGRQVTGLAPGGAAVRVDGEHGTDEYDLVITCAGLQSDRVARMAADAVSPRIVPFFGDYYLLRPEARHLVKAMIYPVPDPRYPFLGVHATKRIDGEILLGPNAFLSLGRETYGRTGPTKARAGLSVTDVLAAARDVREALGFAGFWRFAAHNLPAAARESRTVISRRAFVDEARRYVPAIGLADVRRGPRGIRAQAMDARGGLVDDFVITGSGRIAHVRNAPSPGATSSMAIAEHVVSQVLTRMEVAHRDAG